LTGNEALAAPSPEAASSQLHHELGEEVGQLAGIAVNPLDQVAGLEPLVRRRVESQAVIDAGPAATVLYADESRLQLLPLVRAMWHWVGQQLRIPTPGSNVSRAVFGALNIRSGQWTYLVRQRMRQEDFVAFLEHLLTVYASGPLILIVDNYSSHTAGAVKAWLAQQSRLQLFYLPTYCSDLNPVENIWLRLKNEIAANRLYGSLQPLLDSVAGFFDDMTPELALTWAAQ